MGVIGFTGTQLGMSQYQKNNLYRLLSDLKNKDFDTFIHGDCIGADAEAHEIALNLKYKIIIFPPVVESKRAFCKGASEVKHSLPYLTRNKYIVDCSNFLIAAPKTMNMERRSGTWSTIRYAVSVNKDVIKLERF